jgi:hypothetical protein
VVLARSTQLTVVSLLAAVQLVACAGSSGPPQSKLVDLTLPAGSAHNPPPPRGQLPADEESWHVPLSYAHAIAEMRKRLPVHHDFGGVSWCDDYEKLEDTTWLWEKVGEKIQTEISGGP